MNYSISWIGKNSLSLENIRAKGSKSLTICSRTIISTKILYLIAGNTSSKPSVEPTLNFVYFWLGYSTTLLVKWIWMLNRRRWSSMQPLRDSKSNIQSTFSARLTEDWKARSSLRKLSTIYKFWRHFKSTCFHQSITIRNQMNPPKNCFRESRMSQFNFWTPSMKGNGPKILKEKTSRDKFSEILGR